MILIMNLNNYEKLVNVIKNIINYYFENDIKKLQSSLNLLINNNYNIKKQLFHTIIDNICNDILKELNIYDTTPNINNLDNNEKYSLHKRIQKIFLKFILRYFEYENKTENIIKKLSLNIHYENLESSLLFDFLNNFIPINKTFKNYNKYKLFYTWDDFLNLKNHFL